MANTKELTITTGDETVSALHTTGEKPFAQLVLAHGAGAGMQHTFMEALSGRLAERGINVLRFNFPYMEKGRKAPGSQKQAIVALQDAIQTLRKLDPDLPLFAGGKSYGGRMASHLVAQDTDGAFDYVKGLVYVGFPLHAPGKAGTERAAHLQDVPCPMLFLQGGRDKLALPELITEVTEGLQQATLKMYEAGDHSFNVLKRSGQTNEEVLDGLANATTEWVQKVLKG